MKKLILLIISLVFFNICFSQSFKSPQMFEKQGEPVKAKSNLEVKGVSPATAIFILKLRNNKFLKQISDSDSLRSYYGIKEINNVRYINAFIIAGSKANLNKYGVVEGNMKGNIKTGLIPIEQLHSMSVDDNIEYIEIGTKTEKQLNSALSATWVDEVHKGTGNLTQAYFGEGVIVGVIDIGFDYTHPTFYDSSYSTYRVKRVWEQNATTGTPPAGYSYGRELTSQTTILGAQRDTTESHGTHIAGIAAGSGPFTNALYNGVAYKSDIVLVSTTMQSTDISDAIDYVYDYATSVGKPCVINISLGNHIGPHDGTSAFDQMSDSLTGNGKLLVGAAGNDGEDSLYLERNFSGQDTVLRTFLEFPNSTNGTNGKTEIDIWGTPNDYFRISVNIVSANKGWEAWTPYVYSNSNSTQNFTLYDKDSFSPDSCTVYIASEINPLNNKPRIYIEVDHTSQVDNFQWILIDIVAINTDIKMWANSAHLTSYGYFQPYRDGSSSSTVREIGGTGNSIISVGAYTTKNTYINFSNSTVTVPSNSPIGEIASFSSHGPTADNRTKPDITAPGNAIVAPVNRFDTAFTSTSQETVIEVTDGVDNWYYAAMEGTSKASAMVTGIMALWLEAYPELNPTQALTLLKDNAHTDIFTGTISTIGDNTWGWGKIDAASGLVDLESKIPNKPIITPNGNLFICQGDTILLTAPIGFASYNWNTSATSQNINVPTTGDYFVRVENSHGYVSPWSDTTSVMVQPNPNVPTVSFNMDTLTSSSAVSYQWFLNGGAITGANQQMHIAQITGNYHVEVSDSNSCTSESIPIYISLTGIDKSDKENQHLTIYPNPNKGIFTLNSNINDLISLDILDATGRIVLTYPNIHRGMTELKLENFSSGIYYIRYKDNNAIELQKLILVK